MKSISAGSRARGPPRPSPRARGGRDSGRRGRRSRRRLARRAKPVRVAYLSFAVANSYDAPMLAAAKAVAKAQGAKVTVFDAANDPKKQLAQLQTVATSKQYDAIIVQPIFGPQLIPTIQSAIKAGIKVVNIDQILGTNPEHGGAAGRRASPATSSSSRREIGRSRATSSSRRARAQGEPLQGRLPVLGQGVLARHGDPQGLRRRRPRATTSRSSPRARRSTTRRTRSRRRRRCCRRSPT